MDIQEYKKIINELVNSYGLDWLGIHDCHDAEIAPKIENTGLCVSYNPYGKKSRRFKNEDGTFNLDNDFMATMYNISNGQNTSNLFFCLPVCPVIIRIPTELINLIDGKLSNDELHHFFCGYGYQQPSKITTNSNGHTVAVRGDVEQKPNEKGANIRLLLPCFIAGHIDMSTGKIIPNPKYYDNLPETEKEEVKKMVLANYHAFLQSQNQPQ